MDRQSKPIGHSALEPCSGSISHRIRLQLSRVIAASARSARTRCISMRSRPPRSTPMVRSPVEVMPVPSQGRPFSTRTAVANGFLYVTGGWAICYLKTFSMMSNTRRSGTTVVQTHGHECNTAEHPALWSHDGSHLGDGQSICRGARRKQGRATTSTTCRLLRFRQRARLAGLSLTSISFLPALGHATVRYNDFITCSRRAANKWGFLNDVQFTAVSASERRTVRANLNPFLHGGRLQTQLFVLTPRV